MIALDFETADYNADSACSIGLARIVDGKVAASMHMLIRPPRKRIVFTYLHGISWRMVKDERPFSLAWPFIAEFIGEASGFIAHNASFDRKVLETCCLESGLKIPSAPFFCTLKGARKILKIPSKSLDSVCDYFGLALRHHHAESDAVACAEIYLRLLDLGLDKNEMKLKEK